MSGGLQHNDNSLIHQSTVSYPTRRRHAAQAEHACGHALHIASDTHCWGDTPHSRRGSLAISSTNRHHTIHKRTAIVQGVTCCLSQYVPSHPVWCGQYTAVRSKRHPGTAQAQSLSRTHTNKQRILSHQAALDAAAPALPLLLPLLQLLLRLRLLLPLLPSSPLFWWWSAPTASATLSKPSLSRHSASCCLMAGMSAGPS